MKLDFCNQTIVARIFILVLFTVVIFDIAKQYRPYTFANFDPGWQVTTVQSLVEDGDFDIKNQLGGDPLQAADQVAIGKNGEWYCVHEYLLPVLTTPFYYFWGVNGCLIFNILLFICSFFIVFLLASQLDSPVSAALSVILVLVTSSIRNHSYSFSLDVLGMFTLISALYFFAGKRYIIAGIFSGLSVLSRYSNIAPVTVLVLFLIYEILKTSPGNKELFNILQYALGAVPSAMIFFIANYLMFGGLLSTGYQNNAYLVDGQLQVISQEALFFKNSIIEGLLKILFHPANGIVINTPIIILSLIGLLPLYKTSQRIFWLCILMPVSLLLFYSTYTGAVDNGGGVRHFYFIVLVSVLPLSCLISQLAERAFSMFKHVREFN